MNDKNILQQTFQVIEENKVDNEVCVMRFCPYCTNLLEINQSYNDSDNHYTCKTCSFEHRINNNVESILMMKRKKVDDVLGGKDAWKNVDQADAQCPKCKNTRAYFMQIQTRSADEPMTIFYKCTNFSCNFRWKH